MAFADDIAQLSEEINQAQDLLLRVASVAKVGLKIKTAGKTKFMSYN